MMGSEPNTRDTAGGDREHMFTENLDMWREHGSFSHLKVQIRHKRILWAFELHAFKDKEIGARSFGAQFIQFLKMRDLWT